MTYDKHAALMQHKEFAITETVQFAVREAQKIGGILDLCKDHQTEYSINILLASVLNLFVLANGFSPTSHPRLMEELDSRVVDAMKATLDEHVRRSN